MQFIYNLDNDLQNYFPQVLQLKATFGLGPRIKMTHSQGNSREPITNN